MPKHVAIIMDGNRRWAKRHNFVPLLGHSHALHKTVEPLVEYAAKEKIPYITLWAFSTENWKRSETEVKGLMTLFRDAIHNNLNRLIKKGVRILTIGDLTRFPPDIQSGVRELCKASEGNRVITVIIALNYGGRDEIYRAVEKMKDDNFSNDLSYYLDTSGIPDPDLIIRTGGEKRLSGFLPFQSVYSELYFTKTLFPDFTPRKLQEALREYARRVRRYGA